MAAMFDANEKVVEKLMAEANTCYTECTTSGLNPTLRQRGTRILKEAKETLQSMQMAARGSEDRAKRLALYNEEFKVAQKNWRTAVVEFERTILLNKGVRDNGLVDMSPLAAAEALDTNQIRDMQRATERLQEAVEEANSASAIGTDVMKELRVQREVLEKTKQGTKTISGELIEAHCHVKAIKKETCTVQ
jgi:hypothetical protein